MGWNRLSHESPRSGGQGSKPEAESFLAFGFSTERRNSRYSLYFATCLVTSINMVIMERTRSHKFCVWYNVRSVGIACIYALWASMRPTNSIKHYVKDHWCTFAMLLLSNVLNNVKVNAFRHKIKDLPESIVAVFITARRNARIASAVLAIASPSVLSVRLSVPLSHAGIVSKRRHVARCSLHCQIAKCVYTVSQKSSHL